MTEIEPIVRMSDAHSDVLWDRRHLPVIIARIRGKATTASIDFFFKERNRVLLAAAQREQKIVIINDLSGLAIPPATARKALAEGVHVAWLSRTRVAALHPRRLVDD